jgi:nucleotide-binding universal stress UspA family protein
MNTIVVGVDGSEGSVAALRFAIEEAVARKADVMAVTAWHVPAAVYNSGFVPIPVDVTDYEKLSKAALDETLEKVAASVNGVSITPIVREGQAAEVLVAEAKDADLLVVGSRGLGGFRGLLLGSVSQQCAHHASCPLVVVPRANEA